MAIIGPADLPSVLKVDSTPIKKYILSQLGGNNVNIEITEDQWETVLKVAGDFIAGYFPREQRLAVFNTTPFKCTYAMPADAYWIQQVNWDPVTTRIGDIFGAESYLFNVGNVTGIQNLLTDYHLLQSYRKFSQKILGTEGHWEVIGEVDGQAKDQLIRLYPTPKGVFPVVVLYYPVVNQFRSPQAKMMAYEMMLAESKCMLGMARRKLTGMPTPDGGSISYDGDALVQEGNDMKDKIIQKALSLGEPDQIFLF